LIARGWKRQAPDFQSWGYRGLLKRQTTGEKDPIKRL